MKIFISHSSKNKFYGEALVDLLRSVGIKETEITFTSNTAYGIPVGQNIFNWLKSQITDKPFVIYLLSEEYYQSIACLNEMGAAWVIENKHAAIFTPNFNLSSKEFQSGALDPREIGFYINDEERIVSFIDILKEDFEITNSHIIISQSIRKFLSQINIIKSSTDSVQKPVSITPSNNTIKEKTEEKQSEKNASNTSDQVDHYSKFKDLILSGKLKEDELILIQYVIDTSRYKLMTGWQEQQEIDNIKGWEEINEIENKLSKNYTATLKKFELRGFLEVSAVTASDKVKEFKIRDEISKNLLDLSEDILEKTKEAVDKNSIEPVNNFLKDSSKIDDIFGSKWTDDGDVPF